MADRDERDKVVMDAARALHRAAVGMGAPLGIVFEANVTLAVPAPQGRGLVVGALQGNRLDEWCRVILDRRVPMGTYRLVVALVPTETPRIYSARVADPGKH